MQVTNINGAIKLSNKVVENAFLFAEKPVRTYNQYQQYKVVRQFAHGKFLKMWCDIQEYDYERVRKKLIEMLDKSYQHFEQ